MEKEQEQEFDMDDFDVEDFLATLSEEEFKKLSSAEVITSNDNIMTSCLEAISNANLNSSNTDLMIKGNVKNSLFLILPEIKSLSKENKNKIKDLEQFKKAYENEGKEINSAVDKIKKHFAELSKYTKDILEYIQKVYETHSDDKKEMLKPLINKKNGLDSVDENKIPKEEKQSFINKKKEFNNNFGKYDKKLSDVLKNMKTVFENIQKKFSFSQGPWIPWQPR